MSRGRAAQLVALVGAAALAVGCTAAQGDRSGGAAAPTELVFANNDGNLEGAPGVAYFVQQVEELSGGRLAVRVESDYGGEDRVIEGVAAGAADLGWSGTRAFDTVGVDAFRPMHAPFLVGSYAAQAAVVQDPLADELLGGLEPLGLTGLGLAADQLRMPAAVAGPLLTPGDFAGLVVRTAPSETQVEALRALGAEPTTEGHPLDGEGVDAVETMWWTYQQNFQDSFAPFVTRNAVLWPRSVVLFANTGAMAELDDEARGWITEAASRAVAWSVEHADDAVAEHIRTACHGATRIATATEDQLAVLRSAVEPVYGAMRADEALADTLARIEEIVAGSIADPLADLPDGCAYEPGDEERSDPRTAALTGPGRSGELPQGSYRYTVTVAQQVESGVDTDEARMNAGVFTWTLVEGQWSYEQVPEVPEATEKFGTSCAGWYDVRRDRVTFATSTEIAGGTCAPPSWEARWSVDGNTLTWSDVSIPDFRMGAWERIG